MYDVRPQAKARAIDLSQFTYAAMFSGYVMVLAALTLLF